MAIGLIMEIPGMTAEVYDQVNAKANAPDDPPAGLIFHVSGPTEGGFRIVDVWESREAFDRFASEKLGPTIAEVTGQQGSSPQPTEFSVHNIEFHNG